MKFLISILLTCLMVGSVHAAEDNFLLWMLEEDTTVSKADGSSVLMSELIGTGDAAGFRIEAVRVSMKDSSGFYGTDPIYLELGNAGTFIEIPQYETDFSIDPPTQVGDPEWEVNRNVADISGYTKNPTVNPYISFAIELGAFNDQDEWIILAVTQQATLNELKEGGFIFESELDMQTHPPWKSSFSVPEPTSGLLVLIGGALLSLRRLRRTAA